MKLIFSLTLTSLVMCQVLHASMKSAGALTTEMAGSEYQAKLQPGFHFNDKAPNQIELDGKVIRPKTLEAQQMIFDVSGLKWNLGQATLYVCDDAVTYCEIHKMAVNGLLRGAKPSGTKVTPSVETQKSDNHLGFIVDDPRRALQLAAEEGKAVLVDFSARWCPSCVKFDTETFSSKEFVAASAHFIKLKIDVDVFSNSEFKDRFKIKGIPTLVVLNKNGDEISRMVDWQPLDRVKNFLAEALQGKRTLTALDRAQIEIDQQTEIYANNKSAKQDLMRLLRSQIGLFPMAIDTLAWRAQLLEHLDPKSKEAEIVVREGLTLADQLLRNPKLISENSKSDFLGEFNGFEKWFVANLRADLLDASKVPEREKQNAWKLAVTEARKYNIPVSRKGPSLRYLATMVAAKDFANAEKQVNKMLVADPKNIDLSRRKMKILLEQNRPREVIKIGESVIDQAVGRNQFWIAEILAKAYLAKKSNLDAKRLLSAYLSRPEIESPILVSTKKTMLEMNKSL